MIVLSLGATSFMFWYFVGVFVKKKVIRFTLVVLMISLCVFAYLMNHRTNKVVIMKEDVLYVLPNKND